jgi:hypothetical protein
LPRVSRIRCSNVTTVNVIEEIKHLPRAEQSRAI